MKHLKTYVLTLLLLLGASGSSLHAYGWALPPITISNLGLTDTESAPYVVVDPAGNAVAVWRHSNDAFATSSIQGAYRLKGGSWSAVTTISSTSAGTGLSGPIASATAPPVAVDASGNAIVVWWVNTGATHVIRYSTFTFSTKLWAAEAVVFNNGAVNTADSAVVAVGSNLGNVIVAWNNNNGVDTDIKAATKPAILTGSFTATSDPAATVGNENFPYIAADAAGNAYLVWADLSSGNFDFSFLPFGSLVWNAKEDIPLPPGGTSYASAGSRLAVDPSGNAVAAFHFQVSGVPRVIAAFRPFNGSWSVPFVFFPYRTNSSPFVTMDPFGNATIVYDGNNGFENIVYASTRNFTSGVWSTPEQISSSGVQSTANYMFVQAGANGDLFAAWQSDVPGTPGEVYATNKVFGGSWQLPATLLSADGTNQSPIIGVDPEGNATIVMQNARSASLNMVQSTYFTAGSNPATTFSGTRIQNKFATQTEYIDKLSWQAVPSAVTYTISVGGSVVATVLSNQTLEYSVRQREEHTSYTYTLRAYDAYGALLSTLTATVAAGS